MNDSTPGADTDSESTINCCDDPKLAELPERRFKLPDRRYRETYYECMTCGETWDDDPEADTDSDQNARDDIQSAGAE